MKRTKKLNRKLILYFAAILLLALMIQAVLNYRMSSNIIAEQIELSSSKSLKNMQEEIYTYVNTLKQNLASIYEETEFVEDLKNHVPVETMKTEYKTLAHVFYVDQFNTNQGIAAFYIYDTAHQCISYFRYADTPTYKYPKDIYEDEGKYNSARVKAYVESADYLPFLSSYYNENRQCNMIRFVYKLFVNNRSEQIGYFVCDVDEKVFQKIIGKYTYSEDQIVCLQPVGDRVALTYGTTRENQKDYLNAMAKMLEEGTMEESYELGETGRVFMEPMKKYNLEAYSVVPESILRNETRILFIYILLAAAVTVLIFISSTIFITNYLTKPLEELVGTMKRIKNGETKVRSAIRSGDEIGELSDNFNEMLEKIEVLIAEEYEARLLKDNAEYKALQAQINPHFLYNTLDTMSGIARMKGCEEVSDLCVALSRIFRYSIDMKQPMATLQQELLHLSNYLFVINVRMQNSIRTEIRIAPEHRSLWVPKISLQPIVENAIMHGLHDKHGEKLIQIYTEEADGDILIIVEDNGVGMDAVVLQEELKTKNLRALEKGGSIGLYNINARVKMVFGERCGITVCSEEGNGCKVTLRIRKDGEGSAMSQSPQDDGKAGEQDG